MGRFSQRMGATAEAAPTGGPSRGAAIASGLGQGLLFGGTDEIRAAIEALGPSTYDENVERIRGEQKALRNAYPGTYMASEIAGAVAPALIPGGALVTGSRALGTGARIARAGTTAAAMGGLDAFGHGEGGLRSRAVDAGIGTVAGGVLGVAGETLLGPVVRRISDKLGKSVGSAAELELRRMAEKSGMSVDEIVGRIEAGEVMPEMSPTMRAAAKSLVTRGGRSAETITGGMAERTAQRTGEARQAVQRGLYGAKEVPENALAAWQRSDDQIMAELGGRYTAAYASAPEVTPKLARELEDALGGVPGLGDDIEKVLRATPGAQPLYDSSTGKLVRTPRLEELERARSALRNKVDAAYRAGDHELARGLAAREAKLKTAIDDFAPSLAETRAAYASQSAQSRAFDEARKLTSAAPEEVEMFFSKLGTAEEREAARAGAAQAMRTQWMRGKTPGPLVEELSDPNRVKGSNLFTMLEGTGAEDEVAGALSRANTSRQTMVGVTPRSDTAGNLRSMAEQGGGMVDDMLGMMQQGGVTGAAAGALRRVIKSDLGNKLTDAQAAQVAEIMMSENPELVRKALSGELDPGLLSEAVRRAGSMLVRRAPFEGLLSTMQDD